MYTYWFQFFRISFKFSKLSSVIKGTNLGRSLGYVTERDQKVGAEGEVKEYLHERIPTRLAWIAGVSSIHPRRVLKKKFIYFEDPRRPEDLDYDTNEGNHLEWTANICGRNSVGVFPLSASWCVTSARKLTVTPTRYTMHYKCCNFEKANYLEMPLNL